MEQRTSYLIYSDHRASPGEENSVSGEILFRSDHGVPVLWLFCFGGRNVWDPGDDVAARGGVVGQRNPLETQVEVAHTRLDHAMGPLRANEHVWPWLSAMPILARKLTLLKKGGFVRLACPWVETLPEAQRERWRSATAFVENFVNFMSADRRTEAAESIRRISDFCPFIPEGHAVDKKAFDSSRLFKDQDRAVRLALLTLGEPANRDLFERAVEREVLPALEAYDGLKPLAAPNSSLVKVPTGLADDKAPPAEGGFLKKIKGLFGKK